MSKVLFALSLVALGGLFVGAALGSGNDPLTLTPDSQPGSGGFVEQQSPPGSGWMEACNLDPSSCVVNPTPCLWTADSRVTLMGFGSLAAGASATASLCLIGDWQQHILGAAVQSGSPSLVVKVRYQALDVEYIVPARLLGRDYDYRGCIVGPYYSHSDPQLLSIPDSNGGVGLRTDITLTVTNPTGRKERNVSAQFVIGSSEPSRRAQFCQGGDTGDAFQQAGAIWAIGF